MSISKAAQEMLAFIKGYPKTKSIQWPDEHKIREWEHTVGMERLLREEFEEPLAKALKKHRNR